MTKLFVPKRLRKPIEAENVKDLLSQLDGYYLPCNDENVVLLQINGNFSIPIFKDQNKLVEVMKQIKVSFNKVKQVTNAKEFLGGISTRLPNTNKVSILINPQFNSDSGKLFYTELTLET